MERTPAARAMDMSIQLEKNLRSKTPERSIKALQEIGSQLESWNRQPELSFAENIIFGLVPGEEKLYLNALFLRLADAFRLGSKQVKSEVVILFRKLKRRREGILSKCTLENYLEMIRRVKEVFDDGDVEERRLSLVLFGCWADFTKDCADVRYILLSSLVSGDVLEVKAALFAAGCLCELSDDFADVFFEMLSTMIMSPQTVKDIKLVGGRAFTKTWHSFSVANRAYKAGLKLVMESSEEDLSDVMLISLSKIASKWMHLIPNQIELLTMFFSAERSSRTQATSIACLHYILGKGVCNFPTAADTVQKLFDILQRSDYPQKMKREILNILPKILLFNLSTHPLTEIHELFLKLLVVVESMLQSPTMSTRVVAVNVLADISTKLLGRADIVSGGTGSRLAVQIISFVLDRILLLVTPKVDVSQIDSTAQLEIRSLLNLLFNLVDKHSYLHCLVLKNLCVFMDKLMHMLDQVMDTENTEIPELDISESVSHVKSFIGSKLMPYLSKIVVACLQELDECDGDTSQVLDALKPQLEKVSSRSYFGNYTGMTYILLLHLHATGIFFQRMMEESLSLNRYMGLSCVDSFLQFDIVSADSASKMLRISCNWSSYKAGKASACQGAWSSASLIFEQLKTVVQSVSCSVWLKSLAHFSSSEKQLQKFLLREQGSSIVQDESNLSQTVGYAYSNYVENLQRACNALLFAEKILAAPDMGILFSFQRWFLTLRAKVLKTVVEVIKLLDHIPVVRVGSARVIHFENSTLRPCITFNDRFTSLTCSSTQISSQMKKLAQEFDLLSITFMGIDRQSKIIVSELALSCSLIAFTTGFAFLVPKKIGAFKLVDPKECFHASLIEDLVKRLSINKEVRRLFLSLLKSLPNNGHRSPVQLGNQTSNTSSKVRLLNQLSEFSVRGIVTSQNKRSLVQHESDAISSIINDGSQLLLNITSKLLLIPFQAPNYYFQVRPTISAELFMKNEEGNNVDGVSILPGFHLSLNLCIQLKNMPAGLQSKLKKIHCILSCKMDSQWKNDDMIQLNEKLVRHVVGHYKGDDDLSVDAYVCFRLGLGLGLGLGQGFATCLLDVSGFPEGCYRIKWHSSCVDVEGSYWSLLSVNDGPLFSVMNG